ncbi:MAG: cryptochrome/photolyase family protein [Betaproteobacteria bacterium]|nr:cryptochrome/photolyase family protein [Betaproteobacteria bacterium]
MPKINSVQSIRNLILVLGDQLDCKSSALADADASKDLILMAEVAEESTHVWSSKPRTAYFLAAMRHFRLLLQASGHQICYLALGEHKFASLADALDTAIKRHGPQKVIMTESGDWRVEKTLTETCARNHIPLAIREDRHFLISRRDFAEWARGYKQLRMEFFYRMMRKTHDVLMENGQPAGGRWNYDSENRGAFGKAGPKDIPLPPKFDHDSITRGALADVEQRFANHPGSLDQFNWPVTRDDALIALSDFVEHRLPQFGGYQDAMWADQPVLYHSLLSAALNLKLLNPREVIAAAIEAHRAGKAPLEAVEGFVRQILGWREFIRGMYWLDMPAMREANFFDHQNMLPAWYWTGNTQMNCMKQVISQTLEYGYAHHIQRLMVTGVWALLAEISPQQIEDWYLAVYVDAIDWVELPNVAGMAIYANGGRFTSKPYIASGQYINRMSNYCRSCRYKPDVKTGEKACPFTALYWNFLDKHEQLLLENPRTSLMAKNIARLSDDERAAIRVHAQHLLQHLDAL